MIAREMAAVLRQHATWFPVVCVTGPRQSGKTTLAQLAFPDSPYANLEQVSTLELLKTDPQGFLGSLLAKGSPVVIDEAQRCPELFSWLQVIADAQGRNGLFVITGSQQFLLSDRIAQSLAGRVSLLTLLPLALAECPVRALTLEERLLNGLFPRLYDTRRPAPPAQVLHENYVATYLDRDVRALSAVQDWPPSTVFSGSVQRERGSSSTRPTWPWRHRSASRPSSAGFRFWKPRMSSHGCNPSTPTLTRGW